MKSKYTKIFMIIAVVFAMVAALFVAPKAAYADEQVQLDASEAYDVNAISASIPDTAIISFPVPYESVYGNEIDWEVQAEQAVLSYDDEAHWVVVNRPTEGEDQTVELYLKLNGKVVKTFPITVPAGQTAVPSYSYKLDYNYDENNEVKTHYYKLGQASITLPTPSQTGYAFGGWEDANGKKYSKILVGSMENIELKAIWNDLEVIEIILDTTNVKKSYKGGEALDKTGLVVNALWNDNETRPATEFICSPEVIDWNESGIVTVTVSYEGATATFEVEVSQNENAISDLEIQGWKYGDNPNTPSADALFGQPYFVYSNAIDGEYTNAVPTDAGTYYVKAVVDEDVKGNYKGAESEPVEFVIAKKDITLTTTSKTSSVKDYANLLWRFDTDLLTEDDYENLVVTYHLTEDGEAVTPMAGQTYIVKFSGITLDNYNVTLANSTLTINDEALYFAFENFEGIIYNGENQMFIAKAYAENGDNDILIEDATVVYTYNGQPFTGKTSANEDGYSVTVSIDSPSYGKLEQVVPFVIKKATIDTNSVTLTGGSKEYTGNDQMISVQGLPENDKLEVSYNFDEAINVGTYVVVATISSNDSNYKVSVSELTATLEITKAANSVTVSIQGWKYGENANEPTADEKFGEATFTYATELNGEYTSTVPTNAGTYYVKATVAGTDNYEAASATQEFTIAPAVIDLSNATLTDDSKEYNGNNQMISVQGLPEDDKVVVSYNFTEAINVGTYDVVATISSNDSNYKVSVEKLTATLVITQATNSVTVSIQGWTYGDEPKAPTASATFGEATFTYATELNGEYTSTVPTNAGTYYVKATVAGTDNYEGASDTASFTIIPKHLDNETEGVQVIVLGSDYNTSVETTLTPSVEVYYNQTQITTYDELQYVYGNAETKLGTATVTIVLNGNYEGTLTATFVVTEFGQAGVDAAGLPETIDEAYLTANALPVTVGQGEVKSNVLWIPSNTAVSVNPANGQVSINKAELAEDTTITLTALVTYGTTSAYKVTYDVTITVVPEVEVFDAPYGYEVEAEKVTDETLVGNYTTAVESKEGYEYLTSYNITLKDELGQPAQPNGDVIVRINGEFDPEKQYVVYYYNNDQIVETFEATVAQDGSYVEFTTDHFSVYIVAVEEEVQEDTNEYLTANETYTFANYPEGTQYEENEIHKLDSYITVTTTQAHFTTQLRLYSSSTHDGFAIIECNGLINGLAFNAGYKEDTLNVYGSTDGDEWTLIEGVSITSTSYNNYTVASPFEYKYIKLDVAGDQQIRIASITVSFKYEECKHTELENVDRKEPTCAEVGYTAGVKCSICNTIISGCEEIAPTGEHNYQSEVTAATCTEDGYTTHTCSYCNDSYQDTEVQALGHDFNSNGECTRCDATQGPSASTPELLATFTLGANGNAAHVDGSSLGSNKSYTEDNYTLNLTSLSNVYGPSYDATGNSCIKLGTGSKASSLTFTVLDNVSKVTIYIAKYKSNTSKIDVNGTTYTLTKNSDDGAYDVIEIDTSINKTITLKTLSGGYRAMVNTIEFYGTK